MIAEQQCSKVEIWMSSFILYKASQVEDQYKIAEGTQTVECGRVV